MIACLLIHVERAIGQVKSQFRLFQVIPVTLSRSVNQVWSVVCTLINFCGPIIPDKVASDDEEE